MAAPDPDGHLLLTGPRVEPLLADRVARSGGSLLGWRLEHVDAHPGSSTTATYRARVGWPGVGERQELLGCSVRAGESDAQTWLHPDDPELPGLAIASRPAALLALLQGHGLLGPTARPDELRLDLVTYRPRRRAVVRAQAAGHTWWVKVLREAQFAPVVARHELLAGSGLPAPRLLATVPGRLAVLDDVGGTPLARAIFDAETPCTAEQLVALLDGLPPGVARLERRAPWSEAVAHYAGQVAATLPEQGPRLERLASAVGGALAALPLGDEPTHGDFHEAQLHVAGGRVVGLLDVDTIGPGRRADDLACLLAHLLCMQRMDAGQARRVRSLVRRWLPVFAERVDATELRLRTAAVVVSLATGPYRGQEPHWQAETLAMVGVAENLARVAAS